MKRALWCIAVVCVFTGAMLAQDTAPAAKRESKAPTASSDVAPPAKDTREAPASPADLLSSIGMYRADYALVEIDGSKRNVVRSYSLVVTGDPRPAMARMNSRVPVSYKGSPEQMYDIRTNLDGSVKYVDAGGVLLQSNFEAESVIPPSETDPVRSPVVRRFQYFGTAYIAPGKPFILNAMDEMGSGKRYQLEVTLTKLK